MLEKNVTFIYGDDMFLTVSGQLLVGSRTEVPRFYDQDLNVLGNLGDQQQMFVTQLVPEPASVILVLVGASFILSLGRVRRRAGKSDL
jgi:hypothetical protein